MKNMKKHSSPSRRQRHPAAGLPPLRKPLYLDGAHVKGIALEGPALKVEDELGRHRFYPLARLSRIIMRGQVLLESDVLEAILGAGLSMTILNGDEQILGWLVSAQPLVFSLPQQRLEDAEKLGFLPQALENWRLSRLRMMLLRYLVPHLPSVHLADLRTRTLRNRAASLIHRRTGQDWRRIMRSYRGPLRALAIQKLQEAGVDARWLGADTEKPDLAAMLAGLLEWVLWGAALRGKNLPSFDSWRKRIAFFESNRTTLEKAARFLIDDLNHTLRETLFHLGKRP